MAPRARLLAGLGALALLAGCGAQVSHVAAPTGAQVHTELRGSPPVLAALHAQANQLLGGGETAFRQRLNALRGTPVVVNKWASWCGPCQSEFPVLQRASAQLGRRVAFLGIDSRDQDPAASAFLHRYPVSYPSYTDPQEGIARALQATTFFPQTVFLDRSGRQVYVHAGPYLSVAALIRDVRFYAER